MANTRFTYLFILVLSGLGALAFGSHWAFFVLYSVLLLPLVSLVSLLLYPYGVIHRSRYPQDRVFSGQGGTLTVALRNRGLIVYPDVRVELRDSLAVRQESEEPAADAVAISARQKLSLSYDMLFPYRGVYQIGLKSVTVTDFLGLFRMRFKEKRPVRVVVYPRLIEDFTMPADSRRMNEGSLGYDRFNEDLTDVSDVRKHDPSDDYRKIHWKLTAKRGEFIVKNFHAPGVPLTLIFVDTATTGIIDARRQATLEDTMTSLAASSAQHCIKTRQGARLVLSDQREGDIDITLPEDMEKTLLSLAVLRLTDDKSALPRRIERVLMSKEAFAGMAVVTARLDAPLCELLQAAFSAGHQVYLYYVHSKDTAPSQEEYEVLDRLSLYGITVELVLPNQ